MMRKEPLGQPHASSHINTFITIYGFLDPLANPPGSWEWVGAGDQKREGAGLASGATPEGLGLGSSPS